MTFAAVHQIVAGFAAGDAISLEAVAIRDVCRALGVASEIYAPMENVAADGQSLVRPLEQCRPRLPLPRMARRQKISLDKTM